MEKAKTFFRAYWKIISGFLLIMLLVYLGFLLGIDRKVVAFVVVIIGLITQLFAEMLALLAFIPVLGPVIVKVVSLPFIFLINALGYMVTFFAFRKGYKVEVAKSKLFTTAMLIGVVIGYIIGKLI